jgi:Ogr/Delta-like zinc finger
MEKRIYKCPHCNQELKKWQCPPESSWGVEYLYVCFNDECTYFVNGWEWMKDKFNQRVSYRYRYNPFTGQSGPLPVWSKDALKDYIVD